MEVWTGPVNVYEGSQEGGHGDFSAGEDVGDESGELCVLRAPGCGSAARRGRSCPSHCIVDRLYDSVDGIVLKRKQLVFLEE